MKSYEDMSEEERKRMDYNLACVLYFIRPVGGGPIKIGFTSNLSKRFQEIQACSLVELEVLFSSIGGIEIERAIHGELAEHRLHGEWFRDCAQVHAEIAWRVEAGWSVASQGPSCRMRGYVCAK